MRHRFDSNNGIFVHTLSAPVRLAEFKAIQRDSYAAEPRSRYARVLWDLGGHCLLWSYLEIVGADTDFIGWLTSRRPHGRTAFVTPLKTNHVLLGHLRAAHAWPTEWAFFATVDEARAWLIGAAPR